MVHAASDNTLKLALVGCGGRGTGAVVNALSVEGSPIRLVAMADIFELRLINSINSLKRQFGDRIQVSEIAKFVGFDGYRKAIDSLRRGDIVIFATPAAFRWVHFSYAIERGVHVFMEPPVAVDGPTARRMIELGRLSKEQNVNVGVGLMARHCRARHALFERIRNGEIGDIVHMRSYRMHGLVGSVFTERRRENLSELLWQLKRFQSFLWTSGGLFNDLYIHKIDECCWMKNNWPVRAEALGGRHCRGDYVDQNFDNYAVEYTFEDGASFSFRGRIMVGAEDQYASYVHGSKGMGIVSSAGNFPARCRTFNGHRISRSDLIWSSSQPEKNPHDLEWEDFMNAIRGGMPYHELERGVMAALVASMGRKAAHTGQAVTLGEMLNDEHEFAPGIDQLSMDSPAPLQADAEGRYPVPMPGLKPLREY